MIPAKQKNQALSSTNSISQKEIFGVLLSLLGSVIFYFLFRGEQDIVSDSTHYYNLAQFQIAEEPWGFRFFLPYLTNLFPFDTVIGFQIWNYVALAFISFLLIRSTNNWLAAFLFWTTYTFIFGVSRPVMLDPFFLGIIALLIFVLQQQRPIFYLYLVVLLGTLTHEIFLIFLLLLIIDKVFKSNFFHTHRLSLLSIIGLFLWGILIFASVRYFFPVLEGQDKFMATKTPLEVIEFVLQHHENSLFIYASKVYVTFGHLLPFALLYLLMNRQKHIKLLSFLVMCLVCAAFSLLATEAPRVYAVLYFPVIIIVVELLAKFQNTNNYLALGVLLFFQLSYTVFFWTITTYPELVANQDYYEKIIFSAMTAITLLVATFLIFQQQRKE